MMTVNEVSKLTGVSVRTLQYYDQIGLLKPAEYTEAGYRLYDDTALETLAGLQQDGKLLYGPTVMSHGKPGQETPKGTFTVTRKVKDEISYEFDNAPMPYAVYFTNNGHAFHEGSTNVQSAGCVRLSHDAAKFFFENLQVGDVVYIY